MEEIHYWIAEDGTRFEDGFACEVYEEQQKYEQRLKKDCICLNWNMKRINPLENIEEARCLKVKTEEALNWIREQWDTRGYIIDGLDAPGEYAYDEGRYEWELIQERIDFYTKAKKMLEGA